MAKELTPLSTRDFDAIEAAVLETERGRWFLNEYTKRNRSADTAVLLDAIRKLERAVGDTVAPSAAKGVAPDEIRMNLVEMVAAIAETRRQISAMRPDQGDDNGFTIAADELGAIVTATEAATQNILEAAEQVQESAWTMREAGVDDSYCEKLDTLVTEIYTSCTFQDITGQRISKVVSLMEFLEERLDAMRRIWGGDDAPSDIETQEDRKRRDTRPDAHLLNGPQLDGQGQSQGDVDLIMVDDDPINASEDQSTDASPALVAPSESAAETGIDEDDLFANCSAATPSSSPQPRNPSVAAQDAPTETMTTDEEDEILFSETDIIEDIIFVDEPQEVAVPGDPDDELFSTNEGPVEPPTQAQPDDHAFGDAGAGIADPDDPPPPVMTPVPGDEIGTSDIAALDTDDKLALFS